MSFKVSDKGQTILHVPAPEEEISDDQTDPQTKTFRWLIEKFLSTYLKNKRLPAPLAEYFVRLAERAAPEMRQSRQYYWFQRLEIEHDNLRAALEWTLNNNEPELAVRLVGALGLFWIAQGHHVEGRRWVEHTLPRLEEVSLAFHQRFLTSAGMLAWIQSDIEASNQFYGEALQIAQQAQWRIPSRAAPMLRRLAVRSPWARSLLPSLGASRRQKSSNV